MSGRPAEADALESAGLSELRGFPRVWCWTSKFSDLLVGGGGESWEGLNIYGTRKTMMWDLKPWPVGPSPLQKSQRALGRRVRESNGR